MENLTEVQRALVKIHAPAGTPLTPKLPGDLLALDIRRCLHYLGEITG